MNHVVKGIVRSADMFNNQVCTYLYYNIHYIGLFHWYELFAKSDSVLKIRL